MGLLDRYHKKGGFLQLLSLIESFPAAKQEKFLTLIRDENPVWAEAILKKVVSGDKIFSWSAEVLAEIFPRLSVNIWAIALAGVAEADKIKFFSQLSHSEKRKVNAEESQPTANEIAAAIYKVVVEVRELITRGDIRSDQIGENLYVGQDYEDKMLQLAKYVPEIHGPVAAEMGLMSEEVKQEDVVVTGVPLWAEPDENAPPLNFGHPSAGPAAVGSDSSDNKNDNKKLEALVLSLQTENNQLKSKLRQLSGKLEQIKKIA